MVKDIFNLNRFPCLAHDLVLINQQGNVILTKENMMQAPFREKQVETLVSYEYNIRLYETWLLTEIMFLYKVRSYLS